MGRPSFEADNDALRENGVPTYVFYETTVKALDAMVKFTGLEDKNYDDVIEKIDDVDKDAVQAIFDKS